MTDTSPTETRPKPDATSLAHHRECTKCGYDLFGQPLEGLCPECGSKVTQTANQPLWHVDNPRALTRTRWGLRLTACAFIALLAATVLGIIASVVIVGNRPIETSIAGLSLAAVAIGGVVAILVGLALLGSGVGASGWRRWLPFTVGIAAVACSLFGERLFHRGDTLIFSSAIAVSLFWLLGLSLQLSVVAITPGAASKAPAVRARRFLKLTRIMLFIPVVLLWIGAILFVVAQDLAFAIVYAALYALEITAGLIALWMLLAAIHWLRLIQFLQPPRTLGP